MKPQVIQQVCIYKHQTQDCTQCPDTPQVGVKVDMFRNGTVRVTRETLEDWSINLSVEYLEGHEMFGLGHDYANENFPIRLDNDPCVFDARIEQDECIFGTLVDSYVL